jgi:hypothetical protein
MTFLRSSSRSSLLPDHDLSENRYPLFGIMLQGIMPGFELTGRCARHDTLPPSEPSRTRAVDSHRRLPTIPCPNACPRMPILSRVDQEMIWPRRWTSQCRCRRRAQSAGCQSKGAYARYKTKESGRRPLPHRRRLPSLDQHPIPPFPYTWSRGPVRVLEATAPQAPQIAFVPWSTAWLPADEWKPKSCLRDKMVASNVAEVDTNSAGSSRPRVIAPC